MELCVMCGLLDVGLGVVARESGCTQTGHLDDPGLLHLDDCECVWRLVRGCCLSGTTTRRW